MGTGLEKRAGMRRLQFLILAREFSKTTLIFVLEADETTLTNVCDRGLPTDNPDGGWGNYEIAIPDVGSFQMSCSAGEGARRIGTDSALGWWRRGRAAGRGEKTWSF